MPDKAIGRRLQISTSTAKGHVSALLKRLTLESRQQLLIWAMQHPDALANGVTHTPRMHAPGCTCNSIYCTAMRLAA